MKFTDKLFLVSALALSACSISHAAFDSGSDGSDGALVYGDNLGNVLFDPDAFNPTLDPDRDGIYHFTTITIGSGTYLDLRADVLGHKPLIWLASGDITINGALVMSDGNIGRSPGVGGFYGGKIGGPVDGNGPGGTLASGSPNRPLEDHVNPFLIPLIGGSGMGAHTTNGDDGDSGGGAALIASSTRIAIAGSIYGGIGPNRSGNLRLVANEVEQTGDVNVFGFNIIRVEAFHHFYFSDIFSRENNQLIKTRPGPLFPTNPIKITVVDSNPVDHTKPGANKGEADVTINNGNAVTIEVQCTGIPLGTTIRVVGWNDTVGKVEATTTGLAGTLEASTATCTMVVPTGNTTFMAQAVLAP